MAAQARPLRLSASAAQYATDCRSVASVGAPESAAFCACGEQKPKADAVLLRGISEPLTALPCPSPRAAPAQG